MSDLPSCPKCQSGLTYEDGNLLVCPECAHEWSAAAAAPVAAPEDQTRVVRDAFGAPLADGDSVTVIKDLKIRGSSSVVKVGAKVRNIRLVDERRGESGSGPSRRVARGPARCRVSAGTRFYGQVIGVYASFCSTMRPARATDDVA
ncbi:MAG TPA: zinc ribbon domain-containing protein YjdM [Anaeromyxobacter sp.]